MSIRRRASALVALMALVAALAGCTASAGSPVGAPTTFETGVLAAERDLGSPPALRAVRQATVAAMSDEIGVFVLDRALRHESPDDVLAAVTSPGAVRERAALLGRAHSPRLAARLERAFVVVTRQELDPSRAAILSRDVWASGAFHVERWEGVRVAGDTARVLVRGEDRGTSWDGGPKRDAWAQYKLVLHRDPTAAHGWRVVHRQAASTAV